MIKVGDVCGKLTVIADTGRTHPTKGRILLCKCECLVEKEKYAKDLNGSVKSCGCSRYANRSNKSRSSEYAAWQNMKKRCLNINSKDYLTCIDPLWLHSFDAFLNDVGVRSENKTYLCRKNLSLGFQPGNVIWCSNEHGIDLKNGELFCSKCKSVKECNKFYSSSITKFGYDYICKQCKDEYNKSKSKTPEFKKRRAEDTRKSRRKLLDNNPQKMMLYGAQQRARKKGIECTISENDIIILEYCPVLNIPLIRAKNKRLSDNSPTLDRIDISKGYIPGNVCVISWKANRIKSNASADELKMVADYAAGRAVSDAPEEKTK